MAVNAYARALTDRVVVPVGRLFVRLGATANTLTLVGLLGTVAGMVVLLAGYPVTGAIVAGVAALLDALDGTVARLRGCASRLGSFYDSVADRIADAVIFGVAAWVVRRDPVAFTGVMAALGTAFLTSYVRAKAESLGWNATVGLVERPERVALMLLALGLGFVAVAAWILVVGGMITVAQRLRSVLQQAATHQGS